MSQEVYVKPLTLKEYVEQPNGLDCLTEVVSEPHRARFFDLLEHIDLVCDEHLAPLAEEYRAVCQLMAAMCCQPGTPVVEGRAKAESWAAAILWNVGIVNSLGNPRSAPCLSEKQLAAAFGVSVQTLTNRGNELADGLEISDLDPRWTLPSIAEQNPSLWMVQSAGGRSVDARTLSVPAQQGLAEAGLIPFALDEPIDETESLESLAECVQSVFEEVAGDTNVDVDFARLLLGGGR